MSIYFRFPVGMAPTLVSYLLQLLSGDADRVPVDQITPEVPSPGQPQCPQQTEKGSNLDGAGATGL